MAIRFQLRRGNTAENDAFTGAVGEITVDLGNKELRIHTGDRKQGGYGTARKDFQNITDGAKGLVAHQAMPSNRYIDLTLPGHGEYITMPADGYLVMSIEPGISGNSIGLRNTTAGDIGMVVNMGDNGRYIVHTHVSKGDSVQVYHYNSTPNMFRLVYANGSK